jgi:uncharacterized protein YndB with AHSA1/START domain
MEVTSSGTAVVTLPTDTQIRIVREFDAPARLVFEAYTTPELVKRWWHARRGTATIADIDLRPGGTWRWVMVTHDGTEVAFHGEYREIEAGKRLVYTEIFEMPGLTDDDAAVNTLTFDERDGRTTLTSITETQSRELRDAIIATGMEDGMQDAYDLLEEVAISLA